MRMFGILSNQKMVQKPYYISRTTKTTPWFLQTKKLKRLFMSCMD